MTQDKQLGMTQAYIVIGDIAGELGIMDNPEIQRALDYFSSCKYDEEFLPWTLQQLGGK